MSVKNIKAKVKKLRAKVKPLIPNSALIIKPFPCETDKQSTTRMLATNPDMAGAPRIILRLNTEPVNLPQQE